MRFDNLPPQNDEYTGDLNIISPVKVYYTCKKCNKNIWSHLYNEHIKFCGKIKQYKGLENQEKTINKKERLVNRSSNSKYRRR